jgi:tripartite-type tricarboxylate transporter receptor subunit TctC
MKISDIFAPLAHTGFGSVCRFTQRSTLRTARHGVLAMGVMLTLPWASNAMAAFPEKEVTILVNYGAGGSVDRVARSVQAYLPAALGQGVVVQNIGGANGKIGMKKFMEMPADGYTVLAAFAPATTLLKFQDPKLFDMKDLAIINVQWVDPGILLANKSTGWKNLSDLVTAAKAAPGKVTLAESGAGSVGTILAKDLFKQLDIDVKMVPYRGGGEARKAFLGGETQLTAAGAEGAEGIEDSAVALGMFWPEKISAWPDAKPMNAQLGRTDLPEGGAYRFFAVKTEFKQKYPERFARLVKAFEQVVTKTPEFKAMADKSGVGTDWTGPEKGQALIEKVDASFTKMLKNN